MLLLELAAGAAIAAVFALLGQFAEAVFVLLGTAVAMVSDLLMLLGMRWMQGAGGLMLGLALRWALIGAAMVALVLTVPAALPLIVFVGGLVGCRLIASLISHVLTPKSAPDGAL